MHLVEFILICWGMTQILAIGRVFNAIRPDYYLFKCPMCVGFWVGMFVYLATTYAEVTEWSKVDIWYVFFYGCISSGTSYGLIKAFGKHGVNLGITQIRRLKP